MSIINPRRVLMVCYFLLLILASQQVYIGDHFSRLVLISIFAVLGAVIIGSVCWLIASEGFSLGAELTPTKDPSFRISYKGASAKLVLLTLLVFLISSYLCGVLLDMFNKASYPPLSHDYAQILALVPTILFYWYFSRKKNRDVSGVRLPDDNKWQK